MKIYVHFLLPGQWSRHVSHIVVKPFYSIFRSSSDVHRSLFPLALCFDLQFRTACCQACTMGRKLALAGLKLIKPLPAVAHCSA